MPRLMLPLNLHVRSTSYAVESRNKISGRQSGMNQTFNRSLFHEFRIYNSWLIPAFNARDRIVNKARKSARISASIISYCFQLFNSDYGLRGLCDQQSRLNVFILKMPNALLFQGAFRY